MWTIYVLTDPRTDGIRYVGITKLSLANRLGSHVRKSRLGEQTHRAAWIRVLLSLGLRPGIRAIETTEDRDRECYWIARLRSEGIDLVNTTDGGDGCLGLHSELRERAAAKRRGIPLSTETRARLSASLKGRVCTDEMKAKLRVANLGKKYGPLPDTVKAKMSAAKLGHEVSAETRDKISVKLRGRPTGRTKTHCPKGHEYTEENTFINVRGSKECRICQKERFRQSYLKRKASGKLG